MVSPSPRIDRAAYAASLREFDDRLRALPVENPRFPSDALLVCADYIGELIEQMAAHGLGESAEHGRAFSTALRNRAEACRQHAALLAIPPMQTVPLTPARDFLRRDTPCLGRAIALRGNSGG